MLFLGADLKEIKIYLGPSIGKCCYEVDDDVASYFNGQRTPISGGNGKVTRADVIHQDLFIECKLRAKHTVVSLCDDTAKLAKEEGKTPVIALCEKNRPGFWVMVHSSDLEKINKTK